MAIVGVIPAAGYATRLQPLASSKETCPVHGRPVMDYLVERMKRGGCSEVRVVTRPEKHDVIENARRHGATVIAARPDTPAASLLTGIRSLTDSDLVLFGYPDSIWEPIDGFRPLVELVEAGSEVALGLFRTSQVERPDVVELSTSRGRDQRRGWLRPPSSPPDLGLLRCPRPGHAWTGWFQRPRRLPPFALHDTSRSRA